VRKNCFLLLRMKLLVLLLSALVIIWFLSRPKLIKTCPEDYYYAPWAASGTKCLPVGSASSASGVSSDASIYRPKTDLMIPADFVKINI